ncbi:LysE family translocator [Corynebacterium uterequi]|uniref:Putative threonine efflux protein n=1 Tax=Corynebacterium uterequi TaxID=1072256 RepID=A0A0G3HFW6_9CORY|nr:LysE family translocator [Corynebacterium uterequi]AKK11615.1 putative threonine efflux protein [Corynebacterium uterequi]
MSVGQLAVLAALNILGALTPGPDFVLIMRTATRSRRHAVAVTAGIETGVLVWMALTVLGAAAVLNAFPQLVGVIQVVGGGWVAYLGQSMVRSGWKDRLAPPMDLQASAATLGSLPRLYRHGLATNLSNPKIVLYLAAIIAPLLPASPSPALAGGVIALLFATSLITQMGVALLLSTVAVRRRMLRANPYIDLGAGVFFLVAGATLFIHGLGAL